MGVAARSEGSQGLDLEVGDRNGKKENKTSSCATAHQRLGRRIQSQKRGALTIGRKQRAATEQILVRLRRL